MKYLVSNIDGRAHGKIYKSIREGAFFDLDKSQHGWECFSRIKKGDVVFVINGNRRISVGYEVIHIEETVLLGDHPKTGDKVIRTIGGDTRVLFGRPIKRVDKEYSRFVKENNIKSSKLNPETGKMRQGFNCAEFL